MTLGLTLYLVSLQMTHRDWHAMNINRLNTWQAWLCNLLLHQLVKVLTNKFFTVHEFVNLFEQKEIFIIPPFFPLLQHMYYLISGLTGYWNSSLGGPKKQDFAQKTNKIQGNCCTVWTGNVVPAEIVRRPSGDPPRGGLWIFWLNHW